MCVGVSLLFKNLLRVTKLFSKLVELTLKILPFFVQNTHFFIRLILCRRIMLLTHFTDQSISFFDILSQLFYLVIQALAIHFLLRKLFLQCVIFGVQVSYAKMALSWPTCFIDILVVPKYIYFTRRTFQLISVAFLLCMLEKPIHTDIFC